VEGQRLGGLGRLFIGGMLVEVLLEEAIQDLLEKYKYPDKENASLGIST